MKRTLRLLLAAAVLLVLLIALATCAAAADLTTNIGTVESESGLCLRAKPSTRAEVLATAASGDYVMIIRQVGDWYLVSYDQQVGYMHSDYLDLAEYGRVSLGTATAEMLVVNIRTEPSTDAELVAQISSGDAVEIVGFADGWYKVRYGYATGYVRSDLITQLERPLGNSGMTTAVLAGNVDPAAEIAATRAAVYARRNASSSSSGSATSSSSSTVTSSSSSVGQQLATYAMNYLGCPYSYGGTSSSGFDCSGFAQYIYRQFGISINRTATAQLANGYSVSRSELRPGDLVFFGYGGNYAFHVGIYIGNNQFIHAENYGTGVCISSLSEGYYAGCYLCARRIIG